MPCRLSIIIPALNEASVLGSSLLHLQPVREAGHELIVVDGSSTDDTPALAAPMVDEVIHAPRGRARQMNAGAALARGDTLVFVHADTYLPNGAVNALCTGMAQQSTSWGRFDVRLSGPHRSLRIVEFLMNLRSRLTGIATGDQAIFVQRRLFETVGGFPDIPLMEDIALSRTLRAIVRPLCLRESVITSSRRWERQGIMRTIALMSYLRTAYALGVDPERLVRLYYRA